MADLLNLLVDDHVRVRKMFRRFGTYTGDGPGALDLCEELAVHATLEDELLYPLVRDHVDAALADRSEKDHVRIKALCAEVEALAKNDDLDLTMLKFKIWSLERVFEAHVAAEEREIFPQLASLTKELFDAGIKAFTRTQEFLADHQEPRPMMMLIGANSGWGDPSLGRRDIANSGW